MITTASQKMRRYFYIKCLGFYKYTLAFAFVCVCVPTHPNEKFCLFSFNKSHKCHNKYKYNVTHVCSNKKSPSLPGMTVRLTDCLTALGPAPFRLALRAKMSENVICRLVGFECIWNPSAFMQTATPHTQPSTSSSWTPS